ncbi:fungal-specific transcription factor domain-containing protein [Pyrenochaeta sp. MPI-SDFR-AT-0127]|nr:fungal-specific transcription factor domain-containing protein [Pyrenochaeta sp. MPI-SDFR-AT-0127]
MAERRDKTDTAPRKRALVSCDRCKLRRARCIRDNPDEPCADCKISGVQCESKLPRKQRVYGSVETLSLRYRALESLVKGLFPNENTQDVNTLFNIAASRNIPMPASDDFTPADIFNNSSSQRPLPPQSQQQQPLQTPQSLQPHFPIPQTYSHSVRSVDTASPFSATKESTQHNPFTEAQQPSRQVEELIPTRHGVPHYFGPSSSFRLASTIRGLLARCKAASSADFPGHRASGSSLQRSAMALSDEEYPASRASSSAYERRGLKRSRQQMEETNSQWENREGSPSLDTIGDLLPSRSLADALVAAYFDHVHIYLPLFHRGMFQFRLEATYSRNTELLKDCTDIGWLVALALVFAFGCQQLHEHDPEQAQKLRLKYLSFAKTYFRQLLSTTCLVNVQALVLFNVHHHTIGQKSNSWLLLGLAARMAITMGMHRDGPNMEFDPIERNTRRQVWWSIYTFEKVLCSILGRPSIIDDRESSMLLPDAPMLDQRSMSAEYMGFGFEVIRMSYSIRQRAYFDKVTARERTPTLDVAESLLRECGDFFTTIPAHLSLSYSPVPPDQRARILLLHIYYYYMRCIVSRDFLIQKVERNICYLENKPTPFTEDWGRTLALSEDCVESAHQSIQCIMAGAHLGMIGISWLDLFFIFHSVLIVCADFLARPKEQPDSHKDAERKEMVRAMLNHVRGMKKLAPTYNILSQIAIQFATITGIIDDSSTMSHESPNQSIEPQPELAGGGVSDRLFGIVGMQDEFASATTNLGLDFFDLEPDTGASSMSLNQDLAYPAGYYFDAATNEVEDWTTKALRGAHTM